MSNVWNTTLLRTPCARGPSRASPLLQLFNGYAKSQSRRSFAQWSGLTNDPPVLPLLNFPPSLRAAFSTSACLSAKKPPRKTSPDVTNVPPARPAGKPPRKKPASNPHATDAKIEPAPTVASHTEGALNTEELTWRDYDPTGGMPLAGGERTQPEINAIFNSEEIDVDTGNYILNVMHWRRKSGALIDVGLDFPRESGVTREQARLGLEYVRSLEPDLDEAALGQNWAKEEEERIRDELRARAVKLGLYKSEPGDDAAYEEIEEPQQGTEEGRQRTGESVLQATRKQKEAEFEEWQLEKEMREKQEELNAIRAVRGPLELGAGVQPTANNVQLTTTGPFGIKISRPPSFGQLTAPREKSEWIKYYYEQANLIQDNKIPQMSILARLGPSFLMLVVVLTGCYLLSENYTPPPTSTRIWPDTPPAEATLWALTAVLCTTFVLGRLPPLYRTFSKYMACVAAYPRALSIIGANFRHDTVRHLAPNLVCLWLFGLTLHDDVGRGTFLAIYMGAGVFGGYSSLAYSVLRKDFYAYIYGSSQAVLGVFAAACMLKPNRKMQILGYEIPVAVWVFLTLFTAGEAYAAVRGLNTTINHAGHVAGLVAGGAMALALRLRGEHPEAASTADGVVHMKRVNLEDGR